MLKLPEKQSLELTVACWSWMLLHPDKEKGDWPGWDNPGDHPLTFKGEKIIANCFLCNFYLDCLGCPLFIQRRCETYWKWKESGIEDRRKMAEHIINKCQEKMEDL